MSDSIKLRCPDCKTEKLTQRHRSDPEGTALLVCHCPECAGGDFSLVDYFDANGKQLNIP